MPRYIDAEPLYERTAEWEASALSKIEELNRMPREEMTDEERAEWRRWMAILGERSAFKRDVADEPTADVVERKRGKWIEFDSDEDKYDVIKCPCCKHIFTVDSYHWTDIGFIKDDFKFCPNCGAQMEGE